MARLPGVQAGLAALVLALGGGALVLLFIRLGTGASARRRAGMAGRTAALLWATSDALGDLALLLDERGRIAAVSPGARRHFAPGGDPSGRPIEELLGPEAALLRRGLARGPTTGRLALPDGGAHAVLLRVSARPIRDLLILRPDEPVRPPPLPGEDAPPPSPSPRAARADLGAVGAALLRPIERAATAAGLLRLSLPDGAAHDELRRLEAELADVERRLRWLHAAGGDQARHEGPVDLAALVSELAGKAVPARARLRAQLAPARAWADAGRLRTALREVLRAAAGDLPAGGELWVKVGAHGGRAVLELATAAEAVEAAALARALVVPEGGEVEVEATAGRGGVCRILLPAV